MTTLIKWALFICAILVVCMFIYRCNESMDGGPMRDVVLPWEQRP